MDEESPQPNAAPATPVPSEPNEINSESRPGVKSTSETPVVQSDVSADEPEPEESAVREWFDLIVRAGFWALVLYLFVFQVSVVEGPSMLPNFKTSDRLVIDKLTYKFSSVRRFDVIVFHATELGWQGPRDDTKDFIKRVIGLPGERVRLEGNRVFINGKPLEETFDFDREICYREPSEFVVPPKHYFVMGDNRNDSKDSRRQGREGLGYIPDAQVRGIARLRFMPLDRWNWFWRK